MSDGLIILVFLGGAAILMVLLYGIAILFDALVLQPRWERRKLRTPAEEHARILRERNDTVHGIIAIRRAAEREMQRVAADDVIEGQGYVEN